MSHCHAFFLAVVIVFWSFTPGSAIAGDAEDRIVLGGVEMCGDIEAALDFLKPTNPGKLRSWERKLRKEKKENPDSPVVNFETWNPAVPLAPNRNRKILVTEIMGRVGQVRVFELGAGSRTAYEIWASQMEGKVGPPDQVLGGSTSFVKKVWFLPSGVRVTVGYGANPPSEAAATEFVCTALEGGSNDIF